MADKHPNIVIFDLDETLIHSTREPLGREPEICIETLHVYVRPFAYELIDSVARTC
ncbi:MAG: HAD family hydrolase, partial [Cyanobacteria bacterium]|nr:HAD family hydrolase [Cyanobacteriota bacterium]